MLYPDVYAALAALGVTIRIVTEKDSQVVYIDSPRYVRKTKRFSVCWTTEFTHAEILRDSTLVTFLERAYNIHEATGYIIK